ncbi:MAG TPA: transporter, partial [Draconibacterium sp.]|nr:transporter [Draconibacterium sp.]
MLFIAFAILSGFSDLNAQVLEPRSYSNIPVGMNFLIAAYAYNTGGVLFDPSIPLDNAHININASALAYAYTLKMGGLLGKVDAIVPYAWLSGSAEFQGETVSRVVSGLGDPAVRMSVNFIGVPALSLAEFKDYRQNFILGASMQVFLPLGQYDPDRIVNLGTNRFTIKPELGISKTLG